MVHYRYHLMVRQNVSVLLRAKWLFHQYLVDAYCKIETERLQFLRLEQAALRADCYQDLHDSIFDGDGDPSNVGHRIVLHLLLQVDPATCMNVNRMPCLMLGSMATAICL